MKESADGRGPQVELTAPASGSRVSGTTSWSAQASSPRGVKRVELMVDGQIVASDDRAPYQGPWDTKTVPDGGHTLRARAVDAQKSAVSSPVQVSVANGGGEPGAFQYSTTWFGNTFGGLDWRWIPHGAQGMAVAPDGRVYTSQVWEEGARELRSYKDGTVAGPNPGLHGRGQFGGMAVAVDNTYVYSACICDNVYAVRRFDRSRFDSTTDGVYTGKTMPVPEAKGPILAAAAYGGELYVAVPEVPLGGADERQASAVRINVYDAAAFNGAIKRSFSVPRARSLAFDGAGYLWALQQRDDSTPPQVARYDRQGQLQPQRIGGIDDPVAIAIDPRGAGMRMLVTDNGPDQNIKIYRDIGTSPTRDSTFGVKGGYLAGPRRGEAGPLRFDGPRGVGVDAQGNIYVASNGTAGVGDRVFSHHEYGRQLVLDGYRPDQTLKWRLQGLEFTDRGSADPGSDIDLYTRDEHITFDYSKPPGQQWTFKGRTLDPFTYPQDPRIQRGGTTNASDTTWVRRFGGHRFLFMTGQTGGYVNIFRLSDDDEIAAPAGSFNPEAGSGEYIWGDRNGNGRDDGGAERSSLPTGMYATGWWPDSRGDVWVATRDKGIRRFHLKGLDSHDNPIYGYDDVGKYPMPAPFKDLRRMEYHPDSDTLYLSGYTPATFDNTSFDFWKSMGPSVARYDGWLAGNRNARYVRELQPYSTLTTRDGINKPVSMSVAGDYVFVAWIANKPFDNEPVIRVYRASDGSYVGTMDKRPEIGQRAGWLDVFQAIEAFRRPNGEYIVISEENGWAKNLVYRFCPHTSCA